MKKELDYCPFKGVKKASVAIDGRVIFTFDCPYAKKNNFEKTKKADKKETSMQNRFRFRVYDKYYKGYMQEGSIDIPKVFDGSSFTVEQCTGLKDKNGKLIYEGDIIELYRGKSNIHQKKGKRFEVKFLTHRFCGFGFGYVDCPSVDMALTEGKAKICRVIGNIHENPELL